MRGAFERSPAGSISRVAIYDAVEATDSPAVRRYISVPDDRRLMETFDEDAGGALKAALEDLALDWRGVARQWMFGYPTYRADGTIFALVANDGLVLTRLPEGERERLAEAYETGPFEAGEQTIGTWVHVAAGPADLDALAPFVRASHEAALGESRSVPPPTDEE